MAIVQMKKLDLLCARSQKEDLLRDLMLLGCVELREQDDLLSDEALSPSVSRESSDAPQWRAKRNTLAEALRLLDKYAPVKTPFLAPKPEVQQATFLDESQLPESLEAAASIVELDERLRAAGAEQARQGVLIESLQPWITYDLPLESTGTRQVGLMLGTVPAVVNLADVRTALSAVCEETHLTEISTDEHLHYLSLFYIKTAEDQIMPVLREHGFAAPAFGTVTGTPADAVAQAKKTLQELEADKKSCESKLTEMGPWREKLQRAYDQVGTYVERAEASEKLVGSASVVSLQGYVSAPELPQLEQTLGRYDCAWDLSDPTEEEYGDVPVKLQNNAVTDGLNMVTNMYSLPRYGTLDPNPLMAPFFILFYGIMMADMGYGLVMMLIGFLITTKKKPKTGFLRYFGELMIEGGITTFIMGALTGGFFGDAPLQLARMFNPNTTFQGLPALFNPLDDTIYVLIGAMILGFIQLNVGMVVSLTQKVKRGEVIDGVLYEVALWVIFLGAGIMVLAGNSIVLIIGVVMLFAGSMRTATGIGKLTSIFGTLYNELTGWFGDILSYSRLMALMLAGSVIAQVFNTLGALPGNIIVFIVIFIVGHALNFGLNLLGCYVHDLRLQCLEYFGKFYVDGGKPFKPLAVNTKYVDVI